MTTAVLSFQLLTTHVAERNSGFINAMYFGIDHDICVKPRYGIAIVLRRLRGVMQGIMRERNVASNVIIICRQMAKNMHRAEALTSSNG
jgi:hypothetical protein